MKGSLQLKRGIWHAVISYKDELGKFKTKWISTGLPERGNKKAAKEILDKEIERFEKSLTEAKDKLERRGKSKEVDKSQSFNLFSEYCEKYLNSLKSRAKKKISEATFVSYRANIKKISEYFDERKLRLIDVTDDEIVDFYDHLRKQGLKEVSIKKIADIMRPALRMAYKDKLIPDNPYEFLESLERERPQLHYYNEAELATLFNAIEGDFFEPAIKIAAFYGLRRSELLGLRWNSINFKHKTISINHKILVCDKVVVASDILKTKTSHRTLPLIPLIQDLLLERRAEIEENKSFYGNSYDQRYLDYVFVNETGKLIYPDAITKRFSKILKNNKLKHIRFHDLRHSCASLLLANGVQMKQIQEWLGHANFSTTADVYSHLDFSSKIQSANLFVQIFDKDSTVQMQDYYEKEWINRLLVISAKHGFENVDDYLDYLEQAIASPSPLQLVSEKDDFCM